MDLTEEEVDSMINWDTSSLELFEPRETATTNLDSETQMPAALDELGAMAESGRSSIEQFQPETVFQLNGATVIRMPRLYTGRVLTEADFARIDVSAILSFRPPPPEEELAGPSSMQLLEPDTVFQLNGATVIRMPRLYAAGRVLAEADFARIDVLAILSLRSRLQQPRPTNGLQEEEISKYLEIRSNINMGDEKTVCAICLDNVCGKEDMVAIVEGCGHKFHACCLRRWLPRRNICPLCRRIAISVPI